MTTPTGTLEYLDPATLLTDRNIRTATDLDRGFVASVREHGVIVPIVAVRTPDGIRVRAGHRRTAAATTENLPAVPVLVLDTDPGDDDDAARIVTQIVENHHRAALTTADTLTAVQQLALLGCSEATIAKRTKMPRKTVSDAIAAANSDLGARAAADLPDLTIEHLAWLAEFEDDPQAADRLLDTFQARPEQARHAVERERQQRDLADAREAAYTQVAQAHPGSARYDGQVYADQAAKYLRDLADADRQPLSPEDHDGCPGDAHTLAHLAWADQDTEGIIWANGHGFRVEWLCTDWQANGHHDRYAHAPAPTGPDGADAEQAREQRRRTISLNRAGEAAQTVRREWLTAFTARKSAPKDAPAFLLHGLANHHPAAGEDAARGARLLADLLGEKNLDTWASTQTQARIAQINLCARLWAYEDRTDKSIWRETRRFGDYLRALARWGYDLSDAEKVTTGDLTEQDAAALLTADPGK